MKENTYIIPAIDFYIVPIWSGVPEPHGIFEMGVSKQRFLGSFLPFEEVDGLTIQELEDVIESDTVFLFCAANVHDFGRKSGPFAGIEKTIIDMMIFSTEKLLHATDRNKTIDKVIEEIYESRYQDASKREQEIFNNFFERYQDKNHKETKQRVKRLLGENKK